ncbi:MAG: CDP-alcohol phosphatidyltransferase family protein [Polaribacter sp.]|jgi:CDP-diacylglycerol--serine O-phosphatidyltransferase|nr:CDP-alcohol phosphatidyltransferase family protein [Polaribacter sp.]MBT6082141.1 CDP-alcohol phosphatidyltransferase family protein [Polaribacter sp.]MBT7135055.1 CDP-alcohol phosphatidyltransferase family protein [Polaribacter sp.]
MSKLPAKYQFLDLSDYGRPIARFIANSLRNTKFTPVDVTIAFIISGLIGIYCITKEYYFTAAFFLIFKSILDAADGELARIKKTPSYTGRFLDSVSDIILNLIIFVTLWQVTEISLSLAFLAFFGIQLQGTLYNYYYVILRNRFDGDTTSRIFEDKTPTALPGEKQKNVNILFFLYKLFYGVFDKIIYTLDKNASRGKPFPNWLMTLISTFGLGFQLLLISIFLIVGYKSFIIPFFIAYSSLIFIFIFIRRIFY